jgi:hypothetical protein
MAKYGWINWVDIICRERLEKWGDIFEWNVLEFLNMVQFFKDKKNAELKAYKETMKAHGY